MITSSFSFLSHVTCREIKCLSKPRKLVWNQKTQPEYFNQKNTELLQIEVCVLCNRIIAFREHRPLSAGDNILLTVSMQCQIQLNFGLGVINYSAEEIMVLTLDIMTYRTEEDLHVYTHLWDNNLLGHYTLLGKNRCPCFFLGEKLIETFGG